MAQKQRLLSIQIAQPQEFQPVEGDLSDKPWTTSFYKKPVGGPVEVTPLGIPGDTPADRVNHGGVDKAICVYSADHFAYWRDELGSNLNNADEFGAGAFGENFTVEGLTEPDVCIGDVWRIGTAELQVTQPRQPCWKLARRWRVKDLAAQVKENGYSGWYLRVLSAGSVSPGDEITLVDRTEPEWTLARANLVMHHHKDDQPATEALASLPELSESWREQLGKRLPD